jgi:hypothetical protein
MIRFRYTFLTLAFVTSLFACTKHNGDEEKTPEHIPVASIMFSSPTAGAVFANGDSITIKATAISTENVHGYDLAIRKAEDTTAQYYFTHIHDHNDTLNINEKLKLLVPSVPANLEAQITLVLDHDGHTKREKVAFRVQ